MKFHNAPAVDIGPDLALFLPSKSFHNSRIGKIATCKRDRSRFNAEWLAKIEFWGLLIIS